MFCTILVLVLRRPHAERHNFSMQSQGLLLLLAATQSCLSWKHQTLPVMAALLGTHVPVSSCCLAATAV